MENVGKNRHFEITQNFSVKKESEIMINGGNFERIAI